MKVLSVVHLGMDGIKVIRFVRFCDARGFFTEPYRRSDLAGHPQTGFLKGTDFVQVNESYSRAMTVRGMHFQWNPYMGKLVRTIRGRMVDLFLDIRKGSPTYGKIAAYDMPARLGENYGEWIWVPPGFAHGNFFPEEAQIEYLCSGEYSQGCEAGISPLADDIDWSLCDPALRAEFRSVIHSSSLILSDKDRNALTLGQWSGDGRSQNFLFERLKTEGLC